MYKEKLKDNRWIFLRDDLMSEQMIHRESCICPMCAEPFYENGIKTENINLHHRFYIKGREPWDYPKWAFEFMHEGCHNLFHNGCGVETYSESEFKSKESELQSFFNKP